MLAALRMHLGLSERLLSAKKLFQYLHMIAVTTRVNDDTHPTHSGYVALSITSMSTQNTQ